MPRKKKPATEKTPEIAQDAPQSVSGVLVVNPLTGTPLRARSNEYRPEYAELLVKFYADMLESSGDKLADTLVEEERTLSEAPKYPVPDAEEEKDPKSETTVEVKDLPAESSRNKHLRPPVQLVEKRTVKQRKWRFVCAELPSREKFARLIGVSTHVLKTWELAYPSFAEALNIATDMARDALLQRGLRGQYDSEMVKFVGQNWYGLRDRREITGADGAPLNPPAELRSVPSDVLDVFERTLLEARAKLLGAASATSSAPAPLSPEEKA